MTSNAPPISVSTTPFPPCPRPNGGSASTSTSSPLLSKVLAPTATRPNGLPKGGLADKETIGISRTNSPDLFGSRTTTSNDLPPSPSLTTPFFPDPLHPTTSSPNPLPPPMPFFGGTIVFLPSVPKPHASLPLILPTLPSAPPSPSSSVPPNPSNPLDLKCHARARIPTPHGHVFLHLYKTNQDAKEHLAIVFDPVQMEERKEGRDHIRSRSLDSVWREGETEMERLIRGAYVGRLGLDGGKASKAPEERKSTTTTTNNDANGGGSTSSNSSSDPTFLAPPPPPPTPLVRIHSECFTGETLGSQRCDCGEQLDESLRLISLPTLSDPSNPLSPLVLGRGVIVYLRQEGRGIGLLSKLLAYNLQDLGHDTVEANLALGHGADERKWDVAGGILEDLGFGKDGGEGVRLMTNNPGKVDGLRGEGIQVVERVGMVPRAWETYPHRHQHAEDSSVAYDSSAGGVGPLSLALEGQLHPEVKMEEAEREKERREWMARRGGVGMIGGGETRSEELDRYLKTKVERMGHILELPKD